MIRNIKIALLIEAAVPAVKGGTDDIPDDEMELVFNRHLTRHRVASGAYNLPTTCAPSSLQLVGSRRQN